MDYYIITKNRDGSYTNSAPIPLTKDLPGRPAREAIPARGSQPAVPAVAAVAARTVSVAAPVCLGNARVVTQDHAPTLAEAQAAFGDDALSVVKAAKQAALFASASSALYAIFNALPPGPQAQFATVEQAIVKAAQSGDWAKAAAILSTAIVPAGALATAQEAMVTALSPYLAVVAALQAATTVDAVSAITVP